MERRIDPAKLPGAAAVTIFVVTYFLAVRLGEHTYGSPAVPSPFWLPDSVLLCALLLAPKRQWWFFAIAIWPIRLITGAVPGTALWFQIVSLLNDTLKGVSAAWLLQYFVGSSIRLKTLRELMIFLAVAATALPALSALAAAPARAMLGDPIWTATYKWFLGDAVAQVVVTPTLLYWCTRSNESRDRLNELIVVYAGLAGALIFGFVVDHPSQSLIFYYLPVPFLIWAAVRLGPFGTANATALVAIASMLAAVRGTGVFTGESPEHAVLSIQLFLLMVAIVLLALAIVTVEREALVAREVELTGRLIEAQERERGRIAGELHDDLGQRLALLQIGIEQLGRSTDVSDSGRLQVTTLARSAAEISAGIHDLSHELHPTAIDLLGLEGAVSQLCREFSLRYGLKIELSCCDLPPELERERSLCLYRIAQEALHNVAKHSGVKLASVELRCQDGRVMLSVSDPGHGFDVAAVSHQPGLGLASMRERVRPFGGRVAIEATPQSGTRVDVLVPLSKRPLGTPVIH